MLRRSALACAIALGLASLPARAGLFDDEEARARIDKMRSELSARLDDLAHRADLAAKNQLDFANEIETLKAELAKLRGQTEVMLNDLEAAQKRQRDFYVDLDTRLRKLEGAATAEGAKSAEAKPEAPKADPAAEARDYEAALAVFKAGKYKDSLAAFRNFVQKYPNSGFLPSAHYFAASSLYQLRDYSRAAEAFGIIAATWPDDVRAPDALLAQGNAQLEDGDKAGGRKTLEAVAAKYPDSTAAATAKATLKKLPAPKKK